MQSDISQSHEPDLTWSAPQLIQLGQAGESRGGNKIYAATVETVNYGPSGTIPTPPP
jgi:hypothetical protein